MRAAVTDRPIAVRAFAFGLAVLLWAVGATAGSGKALKYRNADGHVTYSDTPLRDHYQKLVAVIRFGPDPALIQFSAKDYLRNRKFYTPLIDDAAKRLSLRRELLHAVVQAESAYDPHAYSRAGAVGLMQLMPDTAQRYGVSDRLNAKENVDGGARYLHDLLDRFDQNLRLALAAYNAGEGAVEKYGNQVPPFPETRRYVDKVLANLKSARADD